MTPHFYVECYGDTGIQVKHRTVIKTFFFINAVRQCPFMTSNLQAEVYHARRDSLSRT